VLALVVNLEMAHLELVIVFSKAIVTRDNATEEHNLRVAIMAVHLAIAVGLVRRLILGLFIGTLLPDVGKIGMIRGLSG
jgi:HD-GYP domain-containing protein (c-di-GMP phosphodiesterase class II)